MNWNWNRKTRLIIAGSIGVAMILFGISEGVFHYWVPQKAANDISLCFMLAAAVILFSGRRKEQKQKDHDPSNGKETPPEP